MERLVSATEARVHLGRIMREVTEQDVPVIVERAGQEQVVILSVQRYRQMAASQAASPSWLQLLADTRAAVAADLQGRPLPDPAEVIRQGREERDEAVLGLR